MDEVPKERCGLEIGMSSGRPWDRIGYCCFRPVWRNSGRCIWHANEDEKPAKELKKNAKSKYLDKAVLRGVEFTIPPDFSNCSLVDADLADARLAGANFYDARLKNANFSNSQVGGADFRASNLSNTDFSGSDIESSRFDDADVLGTNFEGASLRWSTFRDSSITNPNFKNADLRRAAFRGVNLSGVGLPKKKLHNVDFRGSVLLAIDLSEAELCNANFSNCSLSNADLSDSDIRGGDFEDADLKATDFNGTNIANANFTDANTRGATFDDVNLEDATFIRTELRDANLRDTRLYQTLFSDTRINSNTDFGAKSAYENPDTDLGENYDDTSQWEAAAWVYRRLQNLHEDNAMSERARDYHVRKEEAHRAEYRENGEWFQWGVYTLNRYLTKHGESLKHVVAWSIGIILACGLLYPFTGGLVTANGTEQVTTVSDLSLGLFARSFYYSMVTFTTLGYGNPAGTGAKLLVGLESLAGTLLIALFVFVLGRRVAR